MIELIKEEIESAEILFEAAKQADNFIQCAIENEKLRVLNKLIKNLGVIGDVSGMLCDGCEEANTNHHKVHSQFENDELVILHVEYMKCECGMTKDHKLVNYR